jgi:hypothetical protein
MNLLQKYKKITQKEYNKYLDNCDFKPHFQWNPFDTENIWVYDIENWREFIWGWQCVGYTWEAWGYLMTDKSYGYKLPDAFWNQLNDGWLDTYVWKK